MLQRTLPLLLSALVMVSSIASCTGNTPAAVATPTLLPPSATFLPTQTVAHTSTATLAPSPTDTRQPTATPTPVPPTATPSPTVAPTRTPVPATKTLKPTLPPTSTRAPSVVPPTAPPSAPGVDVVAARGGETCINKVIPVTFPWQGEENGDRKMWYWDKNWSVYPQFARPNIKLQTAKGLCDEQNMCKGLSADFCVYVDANAPAGGTYESVLTLVIASGTKTNVGILAETKIPFSWQIK